MFEKSYGICRQIATTSDLSAGDRRIERESRTRWKLTARLALIAAAGRLRFSARFAGRWNEVAPPHGRVWHPFRARHSAEPVPAEGSRHHWAGLPMQRRSTGPSSCSSLRSSRLFFAYSAVKSFGLVNRTAALSPNGCIRPPAAYLVQEVLPVQRIPLRRTKPRIANNPPQFFFGSAKNPKDGPPRIYSIKRVSHPGANPISANLSGMDWTLTLPSSL